MFPLIRQPAPAALFEAGRLSSSPRPPPPRPARLGLGAEPPLATGSVNPGPFVELPSGDVIDPAPVPTDVPLDPATGAGGTLRGGSTACEALSASPVPGRNEVASPHAEPCIARRGFLADVVAGVSPVRKRPALGDHPSVHVLPTVAAHRDDPTVPIAIALLALNRPSSDPAGKGPGCPFAAWPPAPCRNAALATLWSIHSVEADPLSADLECVPVDHPRPTGKCRT